MIEDIKLFFENNTTVINLIVKILLGLSVLYYYEIAELGFKNENGPNTAMIRRGKIMIVLSFALFIISFLVSFFGNIISFLTEIIINQTIKFFYRKKKY